MGAHINGSYRGKASQANVARPGTERRELKKNERRERQDAEEENAKGNSELSLEFNSSVFLGVLAFSAFILLL
jgi:hypothetical protein